MDTVNVSVYFGEKGCTVETLDREVLASAKTLPEAFRYCLDHHLHVCHVISTDPITPLVKFG